ncbi:MAG: carbohydrate kinase, partial [Desulfovibrionaceae bacterium]|nr:carbohydrate kinase [Desulfovibrionaceae bacterium]
MDFTHWKDKDVRCAGIGEVLFDVFPYSKKLGGAPANFAYHCSQLGFPSMIVSAVGNDKNGEMARSILALNYMPALLPIVNFPTGAVNIEIDRHGVPSYSFLSDTAYDHIPISDYLLDAARMTNVACFGTLAQRSEESHKTIMTFLNLMPEGERIRLFDVNLRGDFYSSEIIKECLEHCDVLKCNAEELPILAGFA